VRAFQSDGGLQLTDGVLVLREQFQDPNARRMPERLEELRLQLVQRCRHASEPQSARSFGPRSGLQTTDEAATSSQHRGSLDIRDTIC